MKLKHTLKLIPLLFVLVGIVANAEKTQTYDDKSALSQEERGDYLFNLGMRYINGEGVPKDLKKGAELITQAATKGHRDAVYELGYLYLIGRGVPEDMVEAMKWIKLAAKSDHAEAQWRLGFIYQQGAPGVARNSKELYASANLSRRI